MDLRNNSIASRLIAPSLLQMRMLHFCSFVAVIYTIVAIKNDVLFWIYSISIYFLTGCLGLSVTLHRCLTHRMIRLARPLEVLFSLFGALGGSGSPLAWATMHRAHHTHVDTHRDPHSPREHKLKLLFSFFNYNFDPRNVRDLIRDPFHIFVHRYHNIIIIIWVTFLSIFGIKAVIFVFFIPVFLQISVSNMATILAHGVGYRSYETNDLSTNNWLIGVIGWGEGWHNNHHASPRAWNFSRRLWEFDAGAMAILALMKLGLCRLEPEILGGERQDSPRRAEAGAQRPRVQLGA